jgi:tetratricopeptide (TPR) repeat protein
MFLKKAITYIILILSNVTAHSQNDSVRVWLQSLKTAGTNMEKARLNVSLSYAWLNKNIDSSRFYFNRAALLFPTSKTYQEQNENLLKTKILNLEADVLVKIGKLNDAEKIYYDLFTRYAAYLNVHEKAYGFLQMGMIRDYQGKSVASVKYYKKAYRIYDSIGDKKGTSECLNNMAVVFYRQGEIDKGIEYLEQSLEIRRNISTKSEIADLLENLGSMHLLKGNTQLAEKYYTEGLGYYKTEGNSWGIAYTLKNLARYNMKLGNYDRSLELCNLILKEHTGTNDSSSISMMNSILSEIYYLKGDYKKGIHHGELAYTIAVHMDIAMRAMEASKALKDVYAADKNYKEAYKFQNLYLKMRDSINNNQTEKESLKQMMEHEQEVERQSYEKDLLIAASEAKRKNLILVFIGIGFLVILFFSGLLLKKFRETKKQKQIIEEQKTEVEHKQKEILDSINYAKRIQHAQLPTKKYIDKSIERLKK